MDLIVTHVPMFFEKAKILQNSCFALGFDTFTRLINLKYYGGDLQILLRLLTEQKNQYGTSFIVGGRLCPVSKTFQKLEESVFESMMMAHIKDEES